MKERREDTEITWWENKEIKEAIGWEFREIKGQGIKKQRLVDKF